MSDGTPEWFPMYPADFLSSQAVAQMTTEEVGAYTLLLLMAWRDEDCSIPDDDEQLARMTRLRDRWRHVSATIRRSFVPHPSAPGRLHNERLTSEWMKALNLIEINRRKGVRSGEARRVRKGTAAKPQVNSGSTTVQQRLNSGSASVEPNMNQGQDNTEQLQEDSGLGGGLTRVREEPAQKAPSPESEQGEVEDRIADRHRDPERVPDVLEDECDAETWRRACMIADLIEAPDLGVAVEGRGEQARAMSLVYLEEAIRKQRRGDWNIIERTVRGMFERAGSHPKLHELASGLQRWRDGAYPGNGRHGAGRTATTTPCRILQAEKILSSLGGPAVRWPARGKSARSSGGDFVSPRDLLTARNGSSGGG
jgi:uncharacterized protein YdaU (DUF1376 family)